MALAPALVELGLLVIVLWIIAFAALIATIIGFVADYLHVQPYPVNQLAGPVESMARGMSSAVSAAFRGVDRAVGWSWHIAARLLDYTWREIELGATVGVTGASIANIHADAIRKLAARTRHTASAASAHTAQVKTLEREFHGIDEQVRTLERELHQGIGHDLRTHIRALEREVATIETHTIPAIQAKDTTFTGEIGNLYDWAKGKAALLGVGTFVTAVTGALALVGNGWLGCRENPFARSSNPCGLWGDLARFLPLLGLLAIAFDFEEFTDAAELLAQGIGASVASIEGAFDTSLPPLPPPA